MLKVANVSVRLSQIFPLVLYYTLVLGIPFPLLLSFLFSSSLWQFCLSAFPKHRRWLRKHLIGQSLTLYRPCPWAGSKQSLLILKQRRLDRLRETQPYISQLLLDWTTVRHFVHLPHPFLLSLVHLWTFFIACVSFYQTVLAAAVRPTRHSATTASFKDLGVKGNRCLWGR